MSSITFRDRKFHRSIDAQFYLMDADKMADVSGWHVGDGVAILFEIDAEMGSAINEGVTAESEVRASSGYGDANIIQVKCVVVKRWHSASWKSVGKFQTLGTHVVLEAENGEWEDVLKWIVNGKKPEWAED